MKVFALGDLHLSGAVNKPMSKFGAGWERHGERIAHAWRDSVAQEDIVLLPGDFSWAMHLEEALIDLQYLHALPGQKVLIRGNHDYWWNSLSKVRAILPPSIAVIQNDCFSYRGVHVAGTRGWACPSNAGFSDEDQKLYARELNRLRMSLDKLPGDGFRVVMTHFPPFDDKKRPSGFSEQISAAKADMAVYGHLHGRACRAAFEGMSGGVDYRLVSADHIDFAPLLLKNL